MDGKTLWRGMARENGNGFVWVLFGYSEGLKPPRYKLTFYVLTGDL